MMCAPSAWSLPPRRSCWSAGTSGARWARNRWTWGPVLWGRVCTDAGPSRPPCWIRPYWPGIGNIYADESLFRAGIDPRRPAGELSEAEAERLRCALQEVLRESIAQCGSSIRDYRDANGNVGAFQNTFFVYGRGGQLCRRCGTELEKGRIAGRATVSCPQCQK